MSRFFVSFGEVVVLVVMGCSPGRSGLRSHDRPRAPDSSVPVNQSSEPPRLRPPGAQRSRTSRTSTRGPPRGSRGADTRPPTSRASPAAERSRGGHAIGTVAPRPETRGSRPCAGPEVGARFGEVRHRLRQMVIRGRDEEQVYGLGDLEPVATDQHRPERRDLRSSATRRRSSSVPWLASSASKTPSGSIALAMRTVKCPTPGPRSPTTIPGRRSRTATTASGSRRRSWRVPPAYSHRRITAAGRWQARRWASGREPAAAAARVRSHER